MCEVVCFVDASDSCVCLCVIAHVVLHHACIT